MKNAKLFSREKNHYCSRIFSLCNKLWFLKFYPYAHKTRAEIILCCVDGNCNAQVDIELGGVIFRINEYNFKVLEPCSFNDFSSREIIDMCVEMYNSWKIKISITDLKLGSDSKNNTLGSDLKNNTLASELSSDADQDSSTGILSGVNVDDARNVNVDDTENVATSNIKVC